MEPDNTNIPQASTMETYCLKMGRANDAGKIEFQAGRNVLDEFRDPTVLSAFVCGDPDKLPSGHLRQTMENIAGTPGKGRKPVDLNHLPTGDLVFKIVRRKDEGITRDDRLVYDNIDASSLLMQNVFDEKFYAGLQHPAFAVANVRDLIDAGNGCSFVSPPYSWLQYVIAVPDETLRRQFYDQPLPGLEGRDGTKIGDVLQICDDDGKERDLSVVSGYTPLIGPHDIVLCGEPGKACIPVRTSMGVSFSLSSASIAIRESISGCGNPSLATCHGFVQAISDSDDEEGKVVLTVRIILAKDNLPSYLKYHRLPQYAVFQTNLVVQIASSWVVSSFRILPLPLHPLPGVIPEDKIVLGAKPAQPIVRDVYVTGHLDFVKGEFKPDVAHDAESARAAPSANCGWATRYEKNGAFALLHDLCARGDAITDEAFQLHHARWKKEYLEQTRRHHGGRFQPKATLTRVAAFDPGAALSTISQCAQLISQPSFGHPLFALRAAIRRYAENKARRAKVKPQASVSVPANIPGSVLLQLVHEYIAKRDVGVTTKFKEGAVEATVQKLEHAHMLIGSMDGKFDLECAGTVEFYGPVTFRWVLYDPKKGTDETPLGVDGHAEVIFSRYVATDKMGGHLTGHTDGGSLRGGGGGGGDRSSEDGGGGGGDGHSKSSSIGEAKHSGADAGGGDPLMDEAAISADGGGGDVSCEGAGGGGDGASQSSPEGESQARLLASCSLHLFCSRSLPRLLLTLPRCRWSSLRRPPQDPPQYGPHESRWFLPKSERAWFFARIRR